MITGDKGDTAKEIGYNCGLFERGNKNQHRIDDEDIELKLFIETLADD